MYVLLKICSIFLFAPLIAIMSIVTSIYNYIPPISNPMTGLQLSLLYDVAAYPTTPPAGPDSIALAPENLYQ